MNSNLPAFAQYILAAMPIAALLALMLGPRWATHRAGPAAWLVSVITALAFGLNGEVFWVSQARGVLLSLYVLAVLWPALLLYHLIDRANGIRALANGLRRAVSDHGLLLLLLAWCFSAVLEGMAGFGLPVAVVSPMLVALGVPPVTAVAAVAVGHAWSVTFGDMGVIFGTLSGVSQMDPALLAPAAGLFAGAACLLCGLSAAQILGQRRLWPQVLAHSLMMGLVQYGMAMGGLIPLAGMFAGLAGVASGIAISRMRRGDSTAPAFSPPELAGSETVEPRIRRPLVGALASYGGLALLMTLIAWPGPLRAWMSAFLWQASFPAVTTQSGFVTAAGPGQAFRPLVHPGTAIFFAALLTWAAYRRAGLSGSGSLYAAVLATLRTAGPASLGIIATVGLSTLMEHTGMTQMLARGMASLMGAAFPLVSPLVGILGAFATGSNNNSNVLFAPLQKMVAELLGKDPRLLLGSQTVGGSLGSMIAPAKIAVGCATVKLKNSEGDVLRRTLGYGIGIGLAVGVLALLFAR